MTGKQTSGCSCRLTHASHPPCTTGIAVTASSQLARQECVSSQHFWTLLQCKTMSGAWQQPQHSDGQGARHLDPKP